MKKLNKEIKKGQKIIRDNIENDLSFEELKTLLDLSLKANRKDGAVYSVYEAIDNAFKIGVRRGVKMGVHKNDK